MADDTVTSHPKQWTQL